MTEAARLEVGRILKPHGLHGEVVVAPITDRADRFSAGSRLYLDEHTVTVTASRPHQQRWLVHLDGVNDRTAADRLRGRVLAADALEDGAGEGAFWVHELVGSEVVMVDGTVCGRVISVEANPAHDMLVLDTGALVPLVFAVEQSEGRVVIDPPAGLFDL